MQELINYTLLLKCACISYRELKLVCIMITKSNHVKYEEKKHKKQKARNRIISSHTKRKKIKKNHKRS